MKEVDRCRAKYRLYGTYVSAMDAIHIIRQYRCLGLLSNALSCKPQRPASHFAFNGGCGKTVSDGGHFWPDSGKLGICTLTLILLSITTLFRADENEVESDTDGDHYLGILYQQEIQQYGTGRLLLQHWRG